MNKITIMFPRFKTKALTFSFDDGIDSDIETVELLTKYRVKATFNLCSGHFAYSSDDAVRRPDQLCMPLSENNAKKLYSNPLVEVASHGRYHPSYAQIAPSAAVYDMISDRRALEAAFGTLVRGHAYPFGSYNDDVLEAMRLCGFEYARTVDSCFDFSIPREDEWLRWRPSCHMMEKQNLERLTNEFTAERNEEYNGWLFYIWGHTYEFRMEEDGFEKFERLLSRLAFRDDTWYATNIEICEYVKAFRSLVYSADGMTVYNPTRHDIYFGAVGAGGAQVVKAGESLRLVNDY